MTGRTGHCQIGIDLGFQVSAPGRIRTRDPLLGRHLRMVAARRLTSLYEASNCTNHMGVSPCVARRLAPVAPRLAPQDLVIFANARMSENSVDHALLHYAALREASHTVNPAAIKQPRGASIGTAYSPRILSSSGQV